MIELVIAVLIIGVMTAPMVTIGLSGRINMAKTDRRLAAAAAVRKVSEALKAYVTADRTVANGPGSGATGWMLPGDSSNLPALESGTHTLDVSTWAPSLASVGGTLSYTVTQRSTPSGTMADVAFTISWND